MTPRQRLAASKMVENGGNIGKAMIAAGYSPATAKNPQKLTESKGWEQILESSGLTDELIITSLVEDIKKKPQKRTKELELAAKLKGLLKEANGSSTFTAIQRAQIDELSEQIKNWIGAP